MEKTLNGALPLGAVAATVTVYWLCVGIMVGRSWLRYRGPAGALPKTRFERRMWLLWVPNTAAWIVLPWLAWQEAASADTAAARGPLEQTLHWLAAGVALAAFVLTTRCWVGMGSNWSMAITPGKATSLITSGTFGVVRHPIYALSALLMFCTVLVVGTGAMLLVGGLHLAMLMAKIISEERHLRALHGAAYAEYCRQTDALIPWRLVKPQRTHQSRRAA